MIPSNTIESGYAVSEVEVLDTPASSQSATSWSAIFAGGVTAAAISAILMLFGTGLGLASISPWPGIGVPATTFTVMAAIWLIIMQWISSAFGGYIAGRLRTKWVGVHTDEVFFRDTAHGFLAWALGTLIVTAVLVSAAGSAVNSGSHLAAATVAPNATADRYYVDLLFRQNAGGVTAVGNTAAPGVSEQRIRNEAGDILAEGMVNNGVSSTDSIYLAQLVTEQTGLAPADAQTRVTDVLNRQHADIVKVKQIADASRKAASGTAIYLFISLLIGAFIASVAGAIGGRTRDA